MAQSFYIRILTLVDDYGRYHAEPRLLRAYAFPYAEDMTTDMVIGLCRELSGAGLAVFYEIENGSRYLQLNKWQEVARSKKSKYPAFDESCKHLKTEDFICSQMSPPSPSPSTTPEAKTPSNGGGVVRVNGDDFLLQVDVSQKPYEPTPIQKRFNRLFKRRDSTHWSHKEEKALRCIGTIPEDDMRAVETYYTGTHQKDRDYRRRDLLTLLNNFNGEVDRARNYKSPTLF